MGTVVMVLVMMLVATMFRPNCLTYRVCQLRVTITSSTPFDEFQSMPNDILSEECHKDLLDSLHATRECNYERILPGTCNRSRESSQWSVLK